MTRATYLIDRDGTVLTGRPTVRVPGWVYTRDWGWLPDDEPVPYRPPLARVEHPASPPPVPPRARPVRFRWWWPTTRR